ncbi:secreted RxLR effector protein 161-like [Cannabis sativa]|uniref:secreted RxLR effector protein 161-like n=1 Tax=Cannabis sativa TaxID=3483 RepID=UPI0029CA9748|nr:secreted RxLR effector protein 161-like [Cannabis sativa]
MEEIPYAKAIRTVMYAMISTRLDIACAVSTLSKFMSNPDEEHLTGLKWLLRYLKTTSNYGLKFEKTGNTLKLDCFVDPDYASNNDTRILITSYYFQLSSCCINLKSQVQHVVALSTREFDFMEIT